MPRTMEDPHHELRRPPFRLINDLEREELLGGLRSLPLRLCAGAVTGLLLYLSGDAVGYWPLCWFAFLPLAFACRGAGAPGAFLVALAVLSATTAAQTLWLLDGPQSPLWLWIAAGAFPAIAIATTELPFAVTRLPWPVRPLIVGVGAVGWYALLPPEAGMMLPLGGLIDSEFTRFAYPKLGLATFAGIFVAMAWLAAELYTRKSEGDRLLSGWPGMLAAGLLVLAGVIDGLGVQLAAKPVTADSVARVAVVPDQPNMDAVTQKLLGPRSRGGIVLWGVRVAENQQAEDAVVESAGRLAQQRQCTIAVVVARPEFSTGYIFANDAAPKFTRRWQGKPGEVDGEPLLVDGQGVLSLQPGLIPPQGFSTNYDLQLCTTAQKPVHAAQENCWLREQRRGALIRGGRQLCVWPGGGAIIDTQGRLVARSRGEPVAGGLPMTLELGEAMGKPRMTVAEKILRFTAPTMTVTLIVLTIVAWAKRRYRARQQQRAEIAIEEVYDGQ